MPLIELLDSMIVNTDDIVTAYWQGEDTVRILIRQPWREIELGPQSAPRAWNVLTQLCRSPGVTRESE